jgi:hypothetical protein
VVQSPRVNLSPDATAQSECLTSATLSHSFILLGD